MKHIITTLTLFFIYQLIFSQSTLHVPFRNDSLWGYADINGEIIVQPFYKEVDYKKHYNDRYYVKQDRYGVIDSKGKVIVNTDYDKLVTEANRYFPFYVFKKNNQYALIDSNAIQFNNELYDSIIVLIRSEDTKYLILKKNKLYKIEDVSSHIIIDSINTILGDSYGYVIFNKKHKYGLFDNDSAILIEPKYDSIIVLNYYSYNKIVALKKNKLYSIQGLSNNIIIDSLTSLFEEFDDIVTFKKNNKYGLFDIENSLLFEPKYDSIISLKSILNKEKYNFSKFKYSLYFKYKTSRYLTSSDFKDTLFVKSFKDIYVDTILIKKKISKYPEDYGTSEELVIPNEPLEEINKFYKYDYVLYKYNINRENAGTYVINGKSYIIDKKYSKEIYYLADSATHQIGIYNIRKNYFMVPFSDSFMFKYSTHLIPLFYIYYNNGKCGFFENNTETLIREPIYDSIECIYPDIYKTYSSNKVGLINYNPYDGKTLIIEPEFDQFEKIKKLKNNKTYFKLFVFKKKNRIYLVGENNVKYYKDN